MTAPNSMHRATMGTRTNRQPKAVGGVKTLERVKGIEPSYEAWEAAVLPLNYTRIDR